MSVAEAYPVTGTPEVPPQYRYSEQDIAALERFTNPDIPEGQWQVARREALELERQIPKQKTHEEYLTEADNNFRIALENEWHPGLEEQTIEAYEKARINYKGALTTTELVDGNVPDPDPILLVKYGGCLARLAGYENIAPYKSAESQTYNRHQMLAEAAVNAYSAASERIGNTMPDEEYFPIISGRAQAYTLQGRYEREYGKPSDSQQNFILALRELRDAKDAATSEHVIEQIEQQIADTEAVLLGKLAVTEEMPLADRVLLELTEAKPSK